MKTQSLNIIILITWLICATSSPARPLGHENINISPQHFVETPRGEFRAIGIHEATVFGDNSIRSNYFRIREESDRAWANGAIVSMEFAKCAGTVHPKPESAVTAQYTDIGPDGSRSHKAYSVLRYSGLYEGTDLLLDYENGRLHYSFSLSGGADPDQIEIVYKGVNSLSIGATGSLRADVGSVQLEHRGLKAYQIINGTQVPVECKFIKKSDQSFGFKIGKYDREYPLVIDPIIYTSFIGGNSDDKIFSMKRCNDGSVIVSGSTMSGAFPATLGSYSRALAGETDIFVSKINPATNQLVFSTLLGGSGSDFPRAMVCDDAGSIFITGYTSSANYPVTAGAYQTTNSGNYDIFVSKLNPTGSALLASTLLGSTGNDIASCIAIAPNGTVVIGGQTSSQVFPTTTGAYDRTFNGNGDDDDAFLTKLNSSLSQLVYSTLLGGGSREKINAVAIDSDGKPIVTGFTYSTVFPVTPNAFQTTFGGGLSDVFVTKFNANASAIEFSTFLGGAMSEEASGIVLDQYNNVYIAGNTWSSNYPVTANAFRTAPNGSCDAFVSKLNANGTALLASTYFGGSGIDRAVSIALDMGGNIICGGITQSTDIPTDAASYSQTSFGDNDAFIARLNPTATQLIFATYFGGTGSDLLSYIATDTTNIVYFGGYTDSGILPESNGGLESYAGAGDGFFGVIRLNSIFITSMADSAVAGRSFAIQFDATGDFDQNNIYTILLSDADGGFENPTVLDTIVGAAGTYSRQLVLPDTVQFSTKYRVMVTASSPIVSKSDNYKGITVLHRFSFVANSITPTEFGTIELGDYDGDGLLDILITGQTATGAITELYRTNPDMSFTKVAYNFPGVSNGTAIFADADGDGKLDIFIAGTTASGDIACLFKNLGDGSFAPVFDFAPVKKCSASFGDYDGDGKPDLVYNGSAGTPSQNIIRLYHNDGNMNFSVVSVGLPSSSAGTVRFIDYNSDGLKDIFVSGVNSVVRYSRIYKNNGNGTFANQTTAGIAGCYNSSADWFDADGDGDEDVLIAGYDNFSRWTRLYRNNSGSFAAQDVALPQVSSGSVRAIDFNADGKHDLLVTGSDGINPIASIYVADGNGSYLLWNDTDLIPLSNAAYAVGDLNADGKPEIVCSGFINSETKTLIYRNNDTNTVSLTPAPTGLAYKETSAGLIVSWDRLPDSRATYSVRIGRSPGAKDVLNSNISANGRLQLGTVGNARSCDSICLTGLGVGTYYCSVTAISAAGNAGAESEEIQIMLADTQRVVLSAGWNEISLFVDPGRVNLESYFSEHPEIMAVYEGTELKYSRGNSVATEAEWNIVSGYVVYAESACELDFVGKKMDNIQQHFQVIRGWNLLPYTKSFATDCADAVYFELVPIAIKDSQGAMNCPALDTHSLRVFTPGRAYWYWFDSPGNFSY